MINFFDCNFWIKEDFLDSKDNIKIKELNKMLADNNIKSAILSNHLSLTYDWNLGNGELVNNIELANDRSVYFSFLIVPEVYILKDFNKYVVNCYRKKVRIFRFFPKSHLFYLGDLYMHKILMILNNLRFPIMIDLKQIDITGNKYFAIDVVENILTKYNRLPLILGCSLKMLMFNRFIFPLLEKYKNLYIETSDLLLINQIEDVVDRFGPGRLIFGTNYPSIEMEFSTGRILLSDLKKSVKEDISFNNINNVLSNIEIG